MKKLLASVISTVLVFSAMPAMRSFSADFSAAMPESTVVSASASNSEAYADRVVKLVNEQRAKNGLNPVKALVSMNNGANIRAKEIVNMFSHERPDGRRGYTAVEDAGLDWSWVGENIAAGYTSPEDVMQGWMESDGHRNNILNPRCKYIGVGYCRGSDGCDYWVQLFMDSAVEYTDFPAIKVQTEIKTNNAPSSKGDVNGDKYVNAVDASEVLSEYANVSTGRGARFSSAQLSAADMNGNGNADAVDASMILTVYVNNSLR